MTKNALSYNGFRWVTAGDGFRTRDPYLGKTERQFRIQNPGESSSRRLLTPNFDVDRLNVDEDWSKGETNRSPVERDHARLPQRPSCAIQRVARRSRGGRPRRRAAPSLGIRTPDALIGATALEHRMSLVTRNLGDFSQVPALRIGRPR